MFFHNDKSVVPNSIISKLVEVLRKNHVNANERVVRIGEPGTAMYILVDGLARYEQGTRWLPKSMRDLRTAARFEQVTQGDSFAEEIIFHLEETYSYTIVALKVSELHSITEDDFACKYKNMPELRKQMCQAFLKSIREQAQMRKDTRERVSVRMCQKA
mmetsp:Transcript_142479/g.273742  ORF Transcript_142479/g.273742 Transcript_142479/m.273742 type:complete len:159 (-) Transcript_142479:25-501(-)